MTPPKSGPYDRPDTPTDSGDELDDYVRAFELAHARRGEADPAAYLPPTGHPLRAAVLRELVRVDLEYGWERGRPRDLSEYLITFPALAADSDGLREIAFEEYRLRRQAGQCASAGEYLTRYGVRIDQEAGRFRSFGPGPSDPGRARVALGFLPGSGLINGDGHSLARTLAPHQ